MKLQNDSRRQISKSPNKRLSTLRSWRNCSSARDKRYKEKERTKKKRKKEKKKKKKKKKRKEKKRKRKRRCFHRSFFSCQFENGVRINRKKITNWTRYAEWEASQNEFERARSVMERALDEDYQNPVLWLKYAELEMQQKNINHARNVFDRAVALLPRQGQLWLRYVFMEGEKVYCRLVMVVVLTNLIERNCWKLWWLSSRF